MSCAAPSHRRTGILDVVRCHADVRPSPYVVPVIGDALEQRVREATATDVRLARMEFDGAGEWLTAVGLGPSEPLAAEVWVFDEDLARVLLVHHRWRGWVPPGGRVEPGETPREGARRELFEETGVEVELLPEPAAATVRSYRPEWPATLGLSFAAVVDSAVPLTTESGQPAAWTSLNEDWAGYFPEDASRVRQHAQWLREVSGRSSNPLSNSPGRGQH